MRSAATGENVKFCARVCDRLSLATRDQTLRMSFRTASAIGVQAKRQIADPARN